MVHRALIASLAVLLPSVASAQTTVGKPTLSIGAFANGPTAYTMPAPSPALAGSIADYRVCGLFPVGPVNGANSTLAVGGGPAHPMRAVTQAGLTAFAGGEITGQIQQMCFTGSADQAFWIRDGTSSQVVSMSGAYTVTAADWANGKTFVSTTGTNTLNLPNAASLSATGGSIFIITRGNPVTVTPSGSTINGGASVILPANASIQLTSDGISAFSATWPPVPSGLTWAPGMALTVGTLRILGTPTVIQAIRCRIDAPVGAAATIDLWDAPTGVVYGAPGSTKITTTGCDANGPANTISSPGGTLPFVVPANNSIGAVFTGFTSASAGAGMIEIIE